MLFYTLALLHALILSVYAKPDVVPESQHLRSPGRGIFKCVFPTPLSGCTVRVSEHNNKYFDKILNFDAGTESSSVTLHKDFKASFAGAGLTKGECGVKMELGKRGSVILFECFGRTVDGHVDRGFGQLTTSAFSVLTPKLRPPRIIMAAPETNVTLLIKTNNAITLCNFISPTAGRLDLSPNKKPSFNSSRYAIHGEGASNGECGVNLTNVQYTDSGVLSTRAYNFASSPRSAAWQATVLLVVEPPVGEPVLEIKDQNSLTVGSLLEAKCQTPPAVPPANITWLLGGQVVKHNDLNDTLPEDLGKSRSWNLQPHLQSFSYRLTAENLTKRLECRMDHLGLADPISVGYMFIELKVTAEKPVVRSSTGYRSQLVCIVEARPAATVLWSRAGVPVMASEMIKIGNDETRHWLSLEDTDADDLGEFTCTASIGARSLSQTITLTGLPGLPEWEGNDLQDPLTWRVESVAPVIASQLKVRQGTGAWREFKDYSTSEKEPGLKQVVFIGLWLPAGSYEAYVKVQNKHGWSVPSHPETITLEVTPTTLPTPAPDPTTTPRPIGLHPEKEIVRTAVGYVTEAACIVDAVPEASVQWSRAGIPVEESGYVVTGNDGDRSWLRLEDTAADDLTNFTCTASNGEASASQVIQLTGLPGTPLWEDNTSPSELAWRVETTAPLTNYRLRIRRGKGKLENYSDIETVEISEGWQLVKLKQRPKKGGIYSAELQVENEFGWSKMTPFHKFTVGVEKSSTPTPVMATVTPTPVMATVTPTPVMATVPSAPVVPIPSARCGLAVMGGVDGNQKAVKGQFPWHAAVYATFHTGREPVCAATLISRRHLLTAAHCVCVPDSAKPFKASKLSVTLGTTARAGAHVPTTQLLAVESVHVNRWYRGKCSFHADLAVLRLRDEVDESTTVLRACVDWHNATEHLDFIEGRAVQMATWGNVKENTLRWEELTYMTESACLDELDDRDLLIRYSQDTVCAEFSNERNVCVQDEGAGLMFYDATTQRHYLRGVSSLPYKTSRTYRGCEFQDWITGFTRISAHLAWLDAIVQAD